MVHVLVSGEAARMSRLTPHWDRSTVLRFHVSPGPVTLPVVHAFTNVSLKANLSKICAEIATHNNCLPEIFPIDTYYSTKIIHNKQHCSNVLVF